MGHLRFHEWWAVLALSTLLIDGGLFFFSPEVQWYVGLSGVLHGIAVAGGFALARGRSRTGVVLIGILVAKLIYEQLFGAVPMSAETVSGEVIVDAHLYGSIGGGIAWWALRLLHRDGAAPV